MVAEGIVLGHKISIAGLEVDQAKVDIIKTRMPPTKIKGIKRFLRHADFYRRFIKTSQKSQGHYVDCRKWMQNLILMSHANLLLMKLTPD